ncbi:hypothetical protein OKA06_18685 [Novosphingobium sp. MW5]|nr:hypothetical protein [Novosphingobium sp. MW5]
MWQRLLGMYQNRLIRVGSLSLTLPDGTTHHFGVPDAEAPTVERGHP